MMYQLLRKLGAALPRMSKQSMKSSWLYHYYFSTHVWDFPAELVASRIIFSSLLEHVWMNIGSDGRKYENYQILLSYFHTPILL